MTRGGVKEESQGIHHREHGGLLSVSSVPSVARGKKTLTAIEAA